MGKLTAVGVENLKTPKRYADGDGLYLEVDAKGNKRWLVRFSLDGKRSFMGLGAYHKRSNSLAMARDAAVDARRLVNAGINPVTHKKEQSEERAAQQLVREATKRANKQTFQACANEWYEANKSQWKNSKHTQQVINTLEHYAFPHIGQRPVAEVSLNEVLSCLNPIWTTKTETADRLRQRIENVFSFSIAKGYREKQNPAQWRGYLDQVLPSPKSLKRTKNLKNNSDGHFAAMDYRDLPDFMSQLRTKDLISARALEFTILTASRTGPVLNATADQFDWTNKVWNVPASQMKNGRPFRVALSDRAIEIAKSVEGLGEYLFAGRGAGKPMSNNTMRQLSLRLASDITVHGFRSSFRDWVGEETDYDYRLAEYALAHTLDSAVERAYARGDQLAKRFTLMNDWADFVTDK